MIEDTPPDADASSPIRLWQVRRIDCELATVRRTG